jgi:CheY-like chemotaxis protein
LQFIFKDSVGVVKVNLQNLFRMAFPPPEKTFYGYFSNGHAGKSSGGIKLKIIFKESMTQKKLKIILAEDETSIREILTELLIDEGYDCVPAADGFIASEKLKNETFDLLISDFRMPRMNGAQLIKWCRDNNIQVPVIFITANLELFPEEKLALNDCCALLLQKPIDFNHLILSIENAATRNHQVSCEATVNFTSN